MTPEVAALLAVVFLLATCTAALAGFIVGKRPPKRRELSYNQAMAGPNGTEYQLHELFEPDVDDDGEYPAGM